MICNAPAPFAEKQNHMVLPPSHFIMGICALWGLCSVWLEFSSHWSGCGFAVQVWSVARKQTRQLIGDFDRFPLRRPRRHHVLHALLRLF
ncbi:hypothetical protein MHYP_G00245320 [Metynnis hypsauchen]